MRIFVFAKDVSDIHDADLDPYINDDMKEDINNYMKAEAYDNFDDDNAFIAYYSKCS